MLVSKAKIDKAGRVLSQDNLLEELEGLEHEDIFDAYRKQHLQPLSRTTVDIQRMLDGYGERYYIAQRLKRKPQILRKLRRFSARLTQLQDIGGCRIIVDQNRDVDRIQNYLVTKALESQNFDVHRITDYRVRGRDDSGYRALHMIVERDNVRIEIQVRSRAQHYWAERIERTSVIYGRHLKELEGAPEVLGYFKCLSDVLHEIESGRRPAPELKIELDRRRIQCEAIVKQSDKKGLIGSRVDEGIIHALSAKEAGGPSGLNNWILIFDWNTGSFVSWDIVSRDPDAAVAKYVECENQYPAADGFEVVLIGSSEVATVRETHSHYFGIDSYDEIAETLDVSIISLSKQADLDIGARTILSCLHRRHIWGTKTVSSDTLKNHWCRTVSTFDHSLGILIDKGFLIRSSLNGGYSLNIGRKQDIEQSL